MKPGAAAILTFGTGLAALGLASPGQAFPFSYRSFLLANRGAEATCIRVVEQQGFRVLDIVDLNEYEGGAEVVLQVRDRRNDLTLGCDYANNSGRVQLYSLNNSWDDDGSYRSPRRGPWRPGSRDDNHWSERWNENRNNEWNDNWNDGWNDGWNDNWNNDWNDSRRRNEWEDYSGDRIRDNWDAEEMARQAVEEQLGVDADSDVIEIDDARQGSRRWHVVGRVNGAPFLVVIRSQDGSIEDFRLR